MDGPLPIEPVPPAPPGRAVLRTGQITVIIPANNEEALIGPCLTALLASDPLPQEIEIIVVANGCSDATVSVARGFAGAAHARGWGLTVLDLATSGKLAALNAGDRIARGAFRAYLDADVTVSPQVLAQLAAVLDRPEPVYASGQLRMTVPDWPRYGPGSGRESGPEFGPGSGWAFARAGSVSRAYARMWARVPFMRNGVPGCGLFAVNGPGRARWGAFPAIIADDAYVRLQFTPAERIGVPAVYDWPIAGSFAALVRVRRRQDRGVQEIAERYPALMANEDKAPLGLTELFALALRDPAGFAVYAAVALAVRIGRDDGHVWSRSR